MKVLVHVCCGPCLYALLPSLRAEGHDVAGIFCNPNIHPYREFRKRLQAARRVGRVEGVEMEVVEAYGLVDFLRRVVGREDRRCALCYEMRLGETARAAARAGADAFTTTLLASPHQQLDVIRDAGDAAAARAGVSFYWRDWRGEHRRAIEAARKRSIYRQSYCGCIYSEYDRYKDTKVK